METMILINSHEIEAAKAAILNGMRNLVASGRVNNREDVIRSLIGAGFDLIEVSEESITLCAPDEPEVTITLEGYLFSQRFQLNYSDDTGDLK
ncbi:hypothetical protein SJZ84_21970 [Hafnia paralvei]|nr:MULTISPECIES: hypothetical protein [Hafnia]MCE9871483.1 hypothetical protein [Hafnia alvei]MDX6913468.1 hypothetical protein [Hafnia paralvei]